MNRERVTVTLIILALFTSLFFAILNANIVLANELDSHEQIVDESKDDLSTQEEVAVENIDYEDVIDEETDLLQTVMILRDVPTSTNLESFLKAVSIDAETDENGHYIINPNSAYYMSLSFGESESYQFSNMEDLIYSFPDGVLIPDTETPQEFDIQVTDSSGSAYVRGNTFRVIDGNLVVRFNEEDENFARLCLMPNVKFTIDISSSFDESVEEIVFTPDIIKEFTYQNESDITISKQVQYDKEANTAYYTITLISSGQNNNVILTDRMLGTALTFNQDVSIKSNISEEVEADIDYNSVENGYIATIREMQNAETVTISYSAAVDNTKISSNGTVEQTENIATVTSDEMPDEKEASANFAGEASFHRIKKRALGDMIQIGEGIYEQSWIIHVNEDYKMQMNGTYIYDWIVANSRPFMTFTGDGITVTRKSQSGEEETYTVSFDDLLLYTNEYGVYGFGYLTPELDEIVSYDIVCTTRIDINNALNDIGLVNGAQVYNSYDEASVTAHAIGESVFAIQKDAVQTTSERSDWKITVTVPKDGLPDLKITDDLPRLQKDGVSYIDYLIEDSIRIEGLYDEESWSIALNDTRRSFTITFYKSKEQTSNNLGVLPSDNGSPRQITVYFSTRVNEEWIAIAEQDGYNTSSLYSHRNVASARSGDYKLPSDDAYVYPIRPAFGKTFVKQADAEINGVTYPVFEYELSLSGDIEEGFTIADAFQTEYLKIYDENGVRISGGMNPEAGGAFADGSYEETNDGAQMTFVQIPKINGAYLYPYYKIHYSLIPKDKASLDALNKAAAEQNGQIELSNTATWDGKTALDKAPYSYYPYVDKALITSPDQENGYTAEFKLEINKHAEDLDPESDVITIRDILSHNLRLLQDTISISPNADGIEIQHDTGDNTLTFMNVPDETAFVIRYKARVLGNGNTAYSNTVQFGKYTKSIEQNVVITSSGSGSASNPSISIVKRDAENLTATLQGAVFQLFTISGSEQTPILDNNGNNVTFTTDENGRALIEGNLETYGWTLWEDKLYGLVEIAAPTGYELNDDPVFFILTQMPESQIEYNLSGDTINVLNTQIKTSVSVEKRWVGEMEDSAVIYLYANEEYTGRSVMLSERNQWHGTFDNLNKYDFAGNEIKYSVKEEPNHNYKTEYQGTQETGFIIINERKENISIHITKKWVGPALDNIILNVKADGEVITTFPLTKGDNWTYTVKDLPRYDATDGHEILYAIEENPVKGYQTEYVIDGYDYTIVNVCDEKLDIPVKKGWVGKPADYTTFVLHADGKEKVKIPLTEQTGWECVFSDLPKYDPEDGHEIEYRVTEVIPSGFRQAVSGNAQDGYVFTNTNIEKISIPVSKRWVGKQESRAFVRLYADDKEVNGVYLTDENNWRHTFSDLDKYDGKDGHEINYTIKEDKIDGYITGISGTKDTGFTITNTLDGKVSIPVTKIWFGRPLKEIYVNLYANGKKTGYCVLNEQNKWQYTFEGLEQYKNGKEIVYSIQEENVPGYDVEISGNYKEGFIITNQNNETTSVPVRKLWIGGEQEEAVVHLFANGKLAATEILTKEKGWEHVFKDVPVYDKNTGRKIKYAVTEDPIPNYHAQVAGDAQKGFVIINTISSQVSFPITKKWIGKRTEEVNVFILANGKKILTVKLNNENGWKTIVTGLDKYHVGNQITYTIEEDTPEGYDSYQIGNQNDGFIITNRKKDTVITHNDTEIRYVKEEVTEHREESPSAKDQEHYVPVSIFGTRTLGDQSIIEVIFWILDGAIVLLGLYIIWWLKYRI